MIIRKIAAAAALSVAVMLAGCGEDQTSDPANSTADNRTGSSVMAGSSAKSTRSSSSSTSNKDGSTSSTTTEPNNAYEADFEYMVVGYEIAITKYKGSGRAVSIPGTIKDMPVTSVEYSAFEGCTSLTSVNVPDGVTKIGAAAFDGCTSLTSVNIPNSVTDIGAWAFEGCSSLTSITIPNGVTSVAGAIFKNCKSLKNLTIPDTVTFIGTEAFYGCKDVQVVYRGNTYDYDHMDDLYTAINGE